MKTRSVPTAAIVLLCLTAGATIGLLAGRLWARTIEREMMRARAEIVFKVQRTFHSREWRRDSIRMDSIRKVRERELPRGWVREIARVQVYRDCVVTFEIPEDWPFPVFTSHARGPGGELLGEASTYRGKGFDAASRATVAFQDLECDRISMLSRGGRVLSPDRSPLHLLRTR